MKAALCIALALVALAGCEREARRLQTPAHQAPQQVARQSALVPGPAPAAPSASGAPPLAAPTELQASYDGNAFAISQGKRFYRWFNCNGCHGQGGGGMGPALMDAQWLYGKEPAQVVQTILHGRPNGMPAFAGRITDDQAWQIAAYVRSMSAQQPVDRLPGRSDGLSGGEPEVRRSQP